jgi:hypothetical protein
MSGSDIPIGRASRDFKGHRIDFVSDQSPLGIEGITIRGPSVMHHHSTASSSDRGNDLGDVNAKNWKTTTAITDSNTRKTKTISISKVY